MIFFNPYKSSVHIFFDTFLDQLFKDFFFPDVFKAWLNLFYLAWLQQSRLTFGHNRRVGIKVKVQVF